MRKLFLTLVLIFLLSFCKEEKSFVHYKTTPDKVSTKTKIKKLDFKKNLPAYQLEWEKKTSLKADFMDEYRQSHPQWYNPTVPPAKEKFRAMTEWEDMQGLLMSYHYYGSEIDQTFTDIIKNSYDVVTVYIIVSTEEEKNHLKELLINEAGIPETEIGKSIQFVDLPSDAIWAIDFGPLPLLDDNNNIAFLDWIYYHDRYNDDAIPTKLGNMWGITTYREPLAYEGGNFQADGMGTCYTTQRELQNTGLSEDELKQTLKEYANCQQLVILKDIYNDGTGHIDMLFKLANKNTVILAKFTSNQDAKAKADMDDNEDILKSVTLIDGSTLTVYRMPMPNPGFYGTEKIPRTYLNSTFINKKNLWPIYSVDKDLEADALAVWQEAMPDYTHIGIITDEISLYSGAIHCITRTIPVGNFVKWVPDGTCSNGTCTGVEGGYSGSCESDADCYGPEWIDPCNGVSYLGCCNEEDGKLYACVDYTLQSFDCGGYNNCGWDSEHGYFNCNNTEVPPLGISKKCGCTPTCDENSCNVDDGCGGLCGCPVGKKCNLATKTCEECTPNCEGKECGDDGCGGSCGTCDDGLTCQNGKCKDACQGITYEGCCDGEVLKYCDNGKLVIGDCTQSQAGPHCGWDSQHNYYDCGTSGDEDPSGQFPKQCPNCEPDCEGIECGDDGCGGSCGTCGEGEACVNGSCVECTPNCEGKECGDDGCGGSCGTCDEGLTCQNGKCKDACQGITYEGCCDGEVLKYCENGKLVTGDCTQTQAGPHCGWDSQNNYYNCGTDGGEDPSGQNPKACPQTCTPNCDGKECGDDGCGGSCGTCDEGYQCQNNKCVKQSECTDECSEGEKGCSNDTTAWFCGEADDGDACLEKIEKSCNDGEKCVNGECVKKEEPTTDVIENSDTKTGMDTTNSDTKNEEITGKDESSGGGGCAVTASTSGASGTIFLFILLLLVPFVLRKKAL